MIDFLTLTRAGRGARRRRVAVVCLILAAAGSSPRWTVDAQSGEQRGEHVFAPAALMATTDEINQRASVATVPPVPRNSPRFRMPQFLTPAPIWAPPGDAAPWLAAPAQASEPLTTALSFTGATLVDSLIPPDPTGAAGPTQFLLAANGRIRTFHKTSGAADGVLNTTTNAFFASVRGAASPFGPRVKFDRLAGRWFVTMATDDVPGKILIASSNQATITASTVWSFFSFENTYPAANCGIDSPTLGIDHAALYIGINEFCGTPQAYVGTSAFVVRKSSAVDSAALVVTAFHNLTGTTSGPGPFAPQGVDNDDPTAPSGYFIGVDNASFGVLMLRRVSNAGGSPSLSPNIAVPVAATAPPIRVRHLGNLGGADGQLDGGDDRLASAKMKNGRLWAVQTVGVDQAGTASATASRNGIRWYELQALDSAPAVLQSGTLNSTAAGVDDRNYWVPSIAASAHGRAVIGFSAAGTSEYVNAGAAERLAGDAAGTLRSPAILTTSAAGYNPAADPGSPTRGRRWGGYSETVLDACDDSTIWTVQQFTDATDSFGLQVTRALGAPPATPVAVAPSAVATGVASTDLTITANSVAGSAFFDPGPGFGCRLTAAIPGVTVNSVTYQSPTSVIVNISTVNAVAGFKPVTITNPDGQSATSASILTILPGPVMQLEWPKAGNAGQPLYVQGWALDGSAQSGTGVDVVHVYAQPAAGAAIFLGAATYGIARPDIAALHGPRFANSGFSLVAPVQAIGAYTITAYAHSVVTNSFNNAQAVNVTLGAPVAPFGALETPADNVTVAGELGVTGWALDDSAVARVEIYRDPVAGEGSAQIFIGLATFVRGSRPDVQAAYPNTPNGDVSGWGYMVLTNMLPNRGNGTFILHAYAVDAGGLRTLLGSRTIIGANALSLAPFGTIDTPGQGETVSGTIVNFGWALTPQPKLIPTNGSTIDVYIDGVMRGHPVYNQPRSDISALFPGLRNSNGAVGYFTLDTTQLANGLHTIAWVVRDDAGQASGIGSRFFRVQN